MISIPALNGLAALWTATLAPALWQSTLVALLLLGAVRLGRRWPAPLRHGLLLLALLKFAVPPAVTSPTALLHLLPKPIAVQAGRAGVQPTLQRPPAAVFLSGARHEAPAGRTGVTPSRPPQPSGRAWMLGAYLLGTIVCLAWIVTQEMRLRGLPPRCKTITAGALHDLLVDLSQRLGLRRRPRLLISEPGTAPIAFGVFHPTVILPANLVRGLSSAQLRVVLGHELAHHKRGDLWLDRIQVCIAALWWFDPFYWWVSRQLRSTREDCCDDLVLVRLLTSGRTYCETLLRAAHLGLRRTPAGVTLACAFEAHPLGRRMSRVMHRGFRPAAAISPVHGTLLLGLGLLLLPGAATKGAEPRASTESRVSAPPDSLPSPRPPADAGDREGVRSDLGSRDPMQRALAATRLGERHDVEAIPQLIELLADETPIPHAPDWNGPTDWTPARTQWLHPSPGEAAAIALAAMSQDAAPALIGALAHPRPAARRNAAWALGELHHPRLPGLPEVPPLLRALGDSDATVRAAAAWGLGETKDRRATSPLIAALHDRDPEVRRQVARALGELADAKAADALLDALGDPDAGVSRTSAWALDEIRDRIGDLERRRGY